MIVDSGQWRAKRKTFRLFTILSALVTVLVLLWWGGEANAQRGRLPYHAFIGGMVGTAQTADFYFPWSGHNASATYLDEAAITPFSGIFKELRCRLPVANDSDESWTFALVVNGTRTAVTCTVGASAQTCSNLVDSAPVTVGDTFAGLGDNTAGGAASVLVRCTVVLYEYF